MLRYAGEKAICFVRMIVSKVLNVKPVNCNIWHFSVSEVSMVPVIAVPFQTFSAG